MFTIETRVLDPLEGTVPFTDYILTNPETGEWATILPQYGGILRQLVLRHQAVRYTLINSPGSAQALLADETYASALLYPFPGRIKQGVYYFDGKAYTLAQNEVSRHHALHGLVHRKPFRVVDQETTPHHAQLSLCHDYPGDDPGYPFPFSLTITYTLSAAGLTLSFEGLNTGTLRCPAAFGWHPYFTLNNTPLDELTLQLPSQTEVTLDDRMIATGTKITSDFYQAGKTLTDVTLDTPWRVDAPEATTRLALPTENVALSISQSHSLGYVVVYTPARRDSIAIEPQTANVDVFNTGDGLVVLKPGETLTGQIKVCLQ